MFNSQFLPTFSPQTGSHTIPTPENQPPLPFFNYYLSTVKKNPTKKRPRTPSSAHLLRNPSDPSILDLQLRSLSKNQDLQPMEVKHGWSWRDGLFFFFFRKTVESSSYVCIYRFIDFILYMNIMVYVLFYNTIICCVALNTRYYIPNRYSNWTNYGWF